MVLPENTNVAMSSKRGWEILLGNDTIPRSTWPQDSQKRPFCALTTLKGYQEPEGEPEGELNCASSHSPQSIVNLYSKTAYRIARCLQRGDAVAHSAYPSRGDSGTIKGKVPAGKRHITVDRTCRCAKRSRADSTVLRCNFPEEDVPCI